MPSKLVFAPIALAVMTSLSSNATPYDYDGDDKADVAVRRASTTFWYVKNTGDNNVNSSRLDGIQRTQFGLQNTDIPVPADYDGDGITDFAVRRPSTFTWYVKNSSGDNTNSSNGDGIQRQVFGLNESDIPVPADYDGDGIADFAVRRASTFTWYIKNSDGSNFNSDRQDGIQRIVFGLNENDIPVAGNFDEDNKADLAVWRASDSTWYIKNSSESNFNSSRSDGIQRITLGDSTDIPVPADYDGDGITDIAVRTPSTFTWTIRESSTGETITKVFGRHEDDIPVPADYDGDGKADVAVRRESDQTFYVLNSSDEDIQRIQFGLQEQDIPVNAPIPLIITKLNSVNSVDTPANSAPVANAGTNQTVTQGDSVQLDGSASSDSDGDALTYAWSFTSRPDGSAASLSNASIASPSFSADAAGDFVLSLIVNDGEFDSSADSVTITVNEQTPSNNAPTANAGVDQQVEQGETVQLTGAASSDADDDELSYSWRFASRPDGSNASLTNSNSASPTFVADVAGAYNLSLIVNDGTVDSNEDSVTITATQTTPSNTAPVASAGSDQDVEQGDTVQLSAANSSDEDGDDLTYAWSFVTRPQGSSASLSDSTNVSPTFIADVAGAFSVSLVVNDGTVDSDADLVEITVNETTPVNNAPIANAGADQQIDQGATVQLSGASSSDADGDTLSYTWSFDARPDGSAASLSSSSIVNPTFVADVAGDYDLSLVVNDGTVSSGSDAVKVTASVTSSEPGNSWIINTNETRSTYIMESDSSLGVLVNVEAVSTETVNGAEYTKVAASGIPDYSVVASDTLVTWLNSRPKASRDFVNGATTAEVGDTILFGQDIGYNSNSSCNTGAGFGYWPPGPVCPEDLDREGYFPNEPATTNEECDTGLGVLGYLVNGTSVYGWGDGQSYNSESVWWNLAPLAEVYDVDICGGHAANGDYHHHFYSTCLAELVGDDGDEHSPLYGYAADGYPIYGPWHDNGQLAISSWATRDYSANSATGCGSDGVRSCVLVDRYDVSSGTEVASSNGPDVGAEVSTLSGNTLEAYSGYYQQDYYWDASLTEQQGAYLDQYNAHDHDGLGYHYHVTTIKNDDGTLQPYYPYMVGDRFAGALQDNSVSMCSTGTSGGGGGGGGGGGPGGPG